MEYYFDNSATTRIADNVIEAMTRAAKEFWGNPSSLHTKGMESEKLMEDCRRTILDSLGVKSPKAELFFCGSGTEADNLALFGCMRAKPRNRGGKLIITDSEHSAIMASAARLEAEGFEVVKLPTRGGSIDTNAFMSALDNKTVMVSCMAVNNETGAHYDIKKIFNLAKAFNPEIVTHTDAVQAYLKVPFNPEALKCDMATISAHKIHGPKGIGALYVSGEIIKTKRLIPLIEGGGQEKGFRSGTENLPAIAGFAQAARAGVYPPSVGELRSYIIENMPAEIRCNLPQKAAPHIINATLPRIKSETMLHFLSSKGIFVSSGSACSSHSAHSNYVLPAFGLTDKEADTSIRISLDDTLTKEDADVLICALNEGLNTLVRIK